MNEDTLVSVIVPIYNVEQYLDRCIKSIVEQDYRQLEIILIDDGSEDSSGELADRWSEIDSRIYVIHQSNAGLSAARNKGIEIAKGNFLIFIDSDDWIHKHMITALISNANKADLICCGMLQASDDKSTPMKWFKKECLYSSFEILDRLIDNTVFTSHITRFLYPKDVFKNIKFPEGKLYEDIRTLHKILLKTNSVYVLPQAYYYYYVRKDSITNTIKLKNRIEWFEALKERAEDLKSYKKEYYEKTCSQMAVVISLAIVQNKFTDDEISDCRNEILYLNKFLKSKMTVRAVKCYATKKQYLYFKFASTFLFNSNKGYNLAKKGICLKRNLLSK